MAKGVQFQILHSVEKNAIMIFPSNERLTKEWISNSSFPHYVVYISTLWSCNNVDFTKLMKEN